MKRTFLVLALAAVVALPFLLRPRQTPIGPADRTLVVITPHDEAIRFEFGRGFQDWYRQRTGRTVAIDWRVIGGTSEITRLLESEYITSFANYWTRNLGRPWSLEVQGAFANGQEPAGGSPEARAARAAFLASDVGCGIDIFFGGGSFEFRRQADAGRLVDSGIMRLHPGWFADGVIPQSFTGQQYWDPQGRWVGTVLSNYGMIYNLDSLARLQVPEPRAWDDLQNPRLAGEVALCDPTMSSSIAEAFENVMQEHIHRAWDRLAGETGRPRGELEDEAVRRGWADGLHLLQRIGANARYFTDSSAKPPIDVQQGNSAVGMCIDFYGRAEEQSVRERSGRDRLGFFSPPAGTMISCDPIGLLRGAPHREVALAFIEYCLSLEGQELWNFRPGTPGGPVRYALRRLPIRRDFYGHAEFGPFRSDADCNPYTGADPLVYHAAWTGGLVRELAFVVRVMCEDTHAELTEAWRAIIAAGMPASALAEMEDLSAVSYEQASGRIKQALDSKSKVNEVRLAKELADQFRRHYRRAAEMARGQPRADGK